MQVCLLALLHASLSCCVLRGVLHGYFCGLHVANQGLVLCAEKNAAIQVTPRNKRLDASAACCAHYDVVRQFVLHTSDIGALGLPPAPSLSSSHLGIQLPHKPPPLLRLLLPAFLL